MRRLILASLLILIASPSLAGWAGHSSTGIVATHWEEDVSGDLGKLWMLLADGTAWISSWQTFQQVAGSPLIDDMPLPVSQILVWDLWSIVALDGEVWRYGQVGPEFAWSSQGTLPIGPVSTDQENMGSMKSGYKTQQQKADDQE